MNGCFEIVHNLLDEKKQEESIKLLGKISMNASGGGCVSVNETMVQKPGSPEK